MISCDTNVLFAALDSRSMHHASARAFLQSVQTNDLFALCELVLTELYVLLRNPVVSRNVHSAPAAAGVIRQFRSHPRWQILDYPGEQAGIMTTLWRRVGEKTFPYKSIYDARLAFTLRYHGVTEFATRNVKDFNEYGFIKVWNPLK